jgi:hypothetical protein
LAIGSPVAAVVAVIGPAGWIALTGAALVLAGAGAVVSAVGVANACIGSDL